MHVWDPCYAGRQQERRWTCRWSQGTQLSRGTDYEAHGRGGLQSPLHLLPPFQSRALHAGGLAANPGPDVGLPLAPSLGGVGRCVGPHSLGTGRSGATLDEEAAGPACLSVTSVLSVPFEGGGGYYPALLPGGLGPAVGTPLSLGSHLGMAFVWWIMRVEGV